MAEKILIVDDDPDTISLFKIILANQGYQVLVAKDGVEALQIAHKELPDLIILDIMLPRADGFEVARSLHRTPDTALIPILMVTARTSMDDKIQGYEVGADIYLTKPVQQMDLQANIKVLLMQRKARKAAAVERGYVAGVIAAKGGVGVSTVALNLAVSYAKKYNEKVIAAEMRPGQGCWNDELNLGGKFGLAELLKMDPSQLGPSIVDSQLVTTDHKVRLLLASNFSQEPVHASGLLQYEAIINGLSSLASLLVLDIGTYFSEAVPLIINQCNEIIMVTEPQVPTNRQTARMADLLRNYGVGSAKPLTIVSLNHTRSDMVISLSQMEELLKRPVALGIPPALELAAHAARVNMPMVVAQPDNLVVQQFNRLVEIVKKHRDNI